LPGGLLKPYGRWQFAYVYGNHAQIYDGDYVVEMYVSLQIFFELSLQLAVFCGVYFLLHQQATMPDVCERAANVGVRSQTLLSNS
jgi:hypothetical protein